MGEVTGIEWTDRSWSPWWGCQQVGPGCDNCYAMALDRRFHTPKGAGIDWARGEGPHWGPHAPRMRRKDWTAPLRWDRAAARRGVRETVFPSMCDPFDNAVDPAWRADFFALIRATPNLTWLLLTKRPANLVHLYDDALGDDPWPSNAALGCTVVNQAEADRDVPQLLGAKAQLAPPFVFLSVEPMLGPVGLVSTLGGTLWMGGQRGCGAMHRGTGAPDCPREPHHHHDERCREGLDWVICGGESGPGARPMHPDWARSLRDQCAAAGVPFLFKQWGEWAPAQPGTHTASLHAGWLALRAHTDGPVPAPFSELYPEAGAAFVNRVGKKAAGRLLDGVLHDARPAALARGVTHEQAMRWAMEDHHG